MPDLEVAARVADRGLDVGFRVRAGEVLAVVGPNGAGKSTAAAVVAGLVNPDEGIVRVGERVVTDTVRRVQVAPHDRRVGLLLQNPLLFPHLDVRGNVAFAARRTAGRAAASTAAMEWLTRVGVGDLAARRPGQLSGGQAQRVAIARALAAQPDVLVLDEPLTGLDIESAAGVRAMLQSLLTDGDRATVLITHDVLDVVALADRVLVVEAGSVAEEGPVIAVLTAPRSAFGAAIAGVNLIRGELTGTGVLRSESGQLWYGCPDEGVGERDAVAIFRPSAVAVYRDRPHGSPRNCVRVSVETLEVIGSGVRVRARPPAANDPGLAADVTADAVAELGLAVGEQVWFTVKAQEVRLHPALPAPARRHD